MPTLQQLVQAHGPPIDVRPQIASLVQLRNDRPMLTMHMSQHTFLAAPMIEPFYEQLSTVGEAEGGLDLFLYSLGGQTEVPASIVAILKEFTRHLGVLLPFAAMSGGTHIALAGEELVMGKLSALGSVDPKRKHHLLPDPEEPHSVQDLKHCIEFVNAQWSSGDGRSEKRRMAKARSESIGDVLRELFEHVHPLAVGALEQSYELARMVTKKVLRARSDFSEDDPRIDRIVEQLAGKYFSHAFFIHRVDVERDLKLPVTRPSDDLWKAMRALCRSYEQLAAQQLQIANGERLHYVALHGHTPTPVPPHPAA